MRIQNNIMALNAHRNHGINTSKQALSVARLSSGKRVNKAADDAAGLAISEKMRAQIRGLNQASRNSQDAVSLVQTAEGGMQTVQDLLHRIREIVVQAGADTNTPFDRQALQLEIDQLMQEIDQIRDATEFNTMRLADGTWSAGIDTLFYEVTPQMVMDTVAPTPARMDAALLAAWINANQSAFESMSAALIALPGGFAPELWESLYNFTPGNGYLVDAFGGNSAVMNPIFTQQAGLLQNLQAIHMQILPNPPLYPKNPLIVQVGANQNQTMGITIEDTNLFMLSSFGRKGPDFLDGQGQAMHGFCLEVLRAGIMPQMGGDIIGNFLPAVDAALDFISMQRAQLGACQNRLEYKIGNLDTQSENLQAAESRIRDTDMALETMRLMQQNILHQSGIAMLAQANQVPQSVLQLLG